MSLISKAYAAFFQGLAKNNNKEWFHANKKAYETDVKMPFLNLVESILPHLRQLNPDIPLEPKKALFRINRDIRFAKDKSPYHLIMKAGFSSGGKKSELPGFYLGIDAQHIHVGGGLFMISPADLKKIRYGLAKESEQFEQIISDANFKSNFGEIQGEKSKRIDKDLREAADRFPLILNKRFYAMGQLTLSDYFEDEGLTQALINRFNQIQPMNNLLEQFINER